MLAAAAQCPIPVCMHAVGSGNASLPCLGLVYFSKQIMFSFRVAEPALEQQPSEKRRRLLCRSMLQPGFVLHVGPVHEWEQPSPNCGVRCPDQPTPGCLEPCLRLALCGGVPARPARVGEAGVCPGWVSPIKHEAAISPLLCWEDDGDW